MYRCNQGCNDFYDEDRYSSGCWGGCTPCPPKPHSCCCRGATGATGAAGATILGSYATYAAFIAAHPTGTAGDAYLVGGMLYVWNAETGAWQGMGSLIGPTGATGATGAVGTILGAYNTLADLIAAHPTGTAGDAYLAGGVLYVWGGEPAAWQAMGSLIGPTGATGAAGATILGSYASLAELEAAHPTGTAGDAYLAGGVLYVWGGEPAAWQAMGSLIGPTGATGAAGATILGSYASLAELEAAHPTGTVGDAYLAGGVLYVWGGEPAAWQDMGSLIGPAGATGATGAVGTILDSYNSLAELEAAHPTGNQGDAYLVNGVLYVWDAENGAWKSIGSLRAPSAESRTIIPFASTVAPYTHALSGTPVRVSLLGFGYGDTRGNGPLLEDYSIAIDASDGHFDLDEEDAADNFQLVFSLPFDMSIKSIALTCGNWGQYAFPVTVYPYVQLYYAEPTSNSFRVLEGAVAIPEIGIGPGTIARGTMRFVLAQDLDIKLTAGTRIAIGGLMRTDAEPTTAEEAYWLYFTGAIGLAYDPED